MLSDRKARGDAQVVFIISADSSRNITPTANFILVRTSLSGQEGPVRWTGPWSLYISCASIRGEALSGEFQIRISRYFRGLNRCFVHQSVRSKIFVSAPGMMHIRIMGLSQRISAEGATYISLGQRPRR